jgi:hypothetical protein
MKLQRLVSKALLAGVVLLLVGAALGAVAAPGVVRCYLVRWSGLDRVAPNVYVDPDMPEAGRQALLASLADGEKRVAGIYGQYTAAPVIIAGHTMDVMTAYGGNPSNRAGKALITPVATFMVLGPNGYTSVDVLSHELAHAEFSKRIGHRNRGKVPNWFEEGMAVQFDERYSEAGWRLRTDDGRTAPDLDELGVIRHDDWLGYATAKHEVGRWLNIVGAEGLRALLQAVQDGSDFGEAYRAIEQAH